MAFNFEFIQSNEKTKEDLKDPQSNSETKEQDSKENVKNIISKTRICINVEKGKRKEQTVVSGLSKEFVEKTNIDLKSIIKEFKKKHGCIGTLKRDEDDDYFIVFSGNHRTEVQTFLLDKLNLPLSQFSNSGI